MDITEHNKKIDIAFAIAKVERGWNIKLVTYDSISRINWLIIHI